MAVAIDNKKFEVYQNLLNEIGKTIVKAGYTKGDIDELLLMLKRDIRSEVNVIIHNQKNVLTEEEMDKQIEEWFMESPSVLKR